VPAAADLPAGEPGNGQDKADNQHDDPDRPQNRDLDDEPDDQQDDARMIMNVLPG